MPLICKKIKKVFITLTCIWKLLCRHEGYAMYIHKELEGSSWLFMNSKNLPFLNAATFYAFCLHVSNWSALMFKNNAFGGRTSISWSFWRQLIKATFKVASYWLVTSGWSEGVLWNLLCLFNLFLSVHQIPRVISASERRCVRKQKTWNVEMEVTAWVVHYRINKSCFEKQHVL